MKQRLHEILANMKRYNQGVMCRECFGLDTESFYDALVVAPGWKPTKTIDDPAFSVTQLTQHSYFSGFLVERDGLRIAWIQTSSGACNLIDNLIVCAEARFHRLIFAGAVGSLVTKYAVGTLCTPERCISGSAALSYLGERITGETLFQPVYPDPSYVEHVIELAATRGCVLERAPVFCTDSISAEYSHLDEIRQTGAELIEMETAAFYTLAELFEVPAVALLAVSDNSASGDPLLGRGEELDRRYKAVRNRAIPELIYAIAAEGREGRQP